MLSILLINIIGKIHSIGLELLIILMLIFLIGSILTILSTNLIALFISIELLGLLMIILINIFIFNKYIGILYYIISGLFSALFIFAISILSINYTLGLKFIYIVFFFKLGLAPFHILLFKIYNNISPILLTIIDIPYKLVIFFVIYKISYFFPNGYLIILINILLGSLGVLNQNNLLNIMIYSSMFNYSLILLALIYERFDYYFYYLIIYGFNIYIFLYLINLTNILIPSNSNNDQTFTYLEKTF